jgi:SPP1 gp7 family putative phage head morphogenesis protein
LATVSNVIERIFNRDITKGGNDKDLFQKYEAALHEALDKGLKSESTDNGLEYNVNEEFIRQMKHNASVFAAFKQHSQINDMVAALFDENGNPRSFGQFKKAVKPIIGDYSKNWLNAEYNHARASARMAAKWQQLKQLNGYIKYKTMRDGRVREQHRVLDGVTLPVNDPFWQVYYPPNGWNCRCTVSFAGKTAEDVKPVSTPDIPLSFQTNVGENPNIMDYSLYKTKAANSGSSESAILNDLGYNG